MHAPELLDLEVMQVFGRLVRSGAADSSRATAGIEALLSLQIRRHSHRGLSRRIWQLRQSLTAYDAAYVSLAELLDAPLLTRGGSLARAPGLPIDVALL